MGRLWRGLSYAHISEATMDKIYRKNACCDLDNILTPLRNRLDGKDYLEEAICTVDRYANKMLKFADIGRATSDERRFVVAYDTAESYLSILTERLERYEHQRTLGSRKFCDQ